MNSVFKQYDVCDDVADMIAYKVHEGHQKKINDHIDVIIGWDTTFDYWTFGNFKTTNLFFPYRTPVFSTEELQLISLFRNIHSQSIGSVNKITKIEYMMYVLSNKNVFKLSRYIRWNQFINTLNTKLSEVTGLTTLSNYFKWKTDQINHKFHSELKLASKIKLQKFSDDPLIWFLNKSNNPFFKKYIYKKDLISWLNANGNPMKLTSKKKKELWDMVMKLK